MWCLEVSVSGYIFKQLKTKHTPGRRAAGVLASSNQQTAFHPARGQGWEGARAWGLPSLPHPPQGGKVPAMEQALGSNDLTHSSKEGPAPITSETQTPSLLGKQSACDLNLRVLGPTSELPRAPRHERSEDQFSTTRSLWQGQAGPAGTMSQYLVGT